MTCHTKLGHSAKCLSDVCLDAAEQQPKKYLLLRPLSFHSASICVQTTEILSRPVVTIIKLFSFIRKDCFQVKSNLLTVDNLVFHL